jgi:heme/copper-type cytochrome/quinol oxidase subunit 2
MEHMTHNYVLGLIALVVSFIVLFYVPLTYFIIKFRKQRNQNK